MKREDHATDWPADLVHLLEQSPRLKAYLYPVGPYSLNREARRVAYDMYKRWYVKHDALLKALHKNPNDTSGDADETFEAALFGLQQALHHSLLDLDDIMNFLYKTSKHCATAPRPKCHGKSPACDA
jgi:hypothetical protein